MKKVMQKCYISPETKGKIKKVAELEHISQSKVVGHWIEKYLDILVFPEDEEKSDVSGNNK